MVFLCQFDSFSYAFFAMVCRKLWSAIFIFWNANKFTCFIIFIFCFQYQFYFPWLSPVLHECKISSCWITNFILELHSLESRVDLDTSCWETRFDDLVSLIALSFPRSSYPNFLHSRFKILSQSSFFGNWSILFLFLIDNSDLKDCEELNS